MLHSLARGGPFVCLPTNQIAKARPVHKFHTRFPLTALRALQTSSSQSQQQLQARSDPRAHGNFYKTHGRALVKALTLAFFSYQLFYWAWITVETEQMKDRKSYEIKSLEDEVRLLDEGRKSHRPAQQVRDQPGQEHGRVMDEAKES